MINITKKIVYNDYNLFEAGDEHEGSTMFHSDGWDMLVDMLYSEYDGLPANRNFVELHGDGMEAIAIDDKRYNPNVTNPNIYLLMQSTIDRYKKIKEKINVVLDSNHWRKLWKWTGDPDKGVAYHICKESGVPYGTYSCRMKYIDSKDRLVFKHYMTHGSKSINSTADDPKRRVSNMELILKRHLKFKAGDCVLMTKGHTHKLLLCRPASELYLTESSDGTIKQAYTESSHTDKFIHPDHRWYLNTGSFRKTLGDGFSDYAEIAEYDPTELGFWIVKVRNREITGADKIILKKPVAHMTELPTLEQNDG